MATSTSTPSLLVEAFVLDGKKFDVGIEFEGDTPLFRATDVGVVLGMGNIRSTIQNYDADERVLRSATVHTMDGAGVPVGGTDKGREVIFLTEEGLYRLLMQSRKPAARPFQKWASRVLKTIRETGAYSLAEKDREMATQAALHGEEIARLAREHAVAAQLGAVTAAERARHDAILDLMRHKTLVYFGKIRTEPDGRMLIKIGLSKDVGMRAPSLVNEFGSMTLLEAFEVVAYPQFEEFLHEHPFMAARRFKDVIHGTRRSHREVVLLTEEELRHAIGIAKKRAPVYCTQATLDGYVELETKKLQHAQAVAADAAGPSTGGERQTTKELARDIEQLTVAMLSNPKGFNQSRGPKVQRYGADGALLATYAGYMEACRDPVLPVSTPGCIKRAARERMLYKGFRWADLDRELPDAFVQDIGTTVETQTARIGLVAMLDLDKTRVVKVFSDMTAAATDRRFKTPAPISNAVKRGASSGGHHFRMWHDCEEELQDAYLADNELPTRKRKGSTSVVRTNPLTDEETTFGSIAEVQRAIQVARVTLRDALTSGCLLKGYRWKLVQEGSGGNDEEDGGERTTSDES